MKQLFFISFLLWVALPFGFCQGEIESTATASAQKEVSEKPNTIASLIEDRKQQRASFQQINPFTFEPAKQRNAYQAALSEAVILTFDPSEIVKLWRRPARDLELSIPIARNKRILLDLTQVNVKSRQFKVRTGSGRALESIPDVLTYQGIIHGDERSFAAVSIINEEVRILLSDETGNYVVGAIRGKRDEYVFYNDQDLKEENHFQCSSLDSRASVKPSLVDTTSLSSNRMWGGGCVEIYFECDFNMYQSFSNNSGSIVGYVLGLFNEVAALYRQEQINVEISEILIWDTPDPYLSASNISKQLELFAQTLQNNYSGRLAHLLSTRFDRAGLAWQDELCSNYYTFMADFDEDGVEELQHAGPYAVSKIDTWYSSVPMHSWDVEVVTHEIGHNLGSPHTHACEWNGNDTQIDDCGNTSGSSRDGVFDDDDDGIADDGCFNPFADPPQQPIIPNDGGTIMSYCDKNFSLGFGQQPGDLIRSRVASSFCLGENCSCEEFINRLVNGSPIAAAVYTASEVIYSSGDADEDNIVAFHAGERVELQEGFEATGTFVAQVVDTLCDWTGADDFDMPYAVSQRSGTENPDNDQQLRVWPNPVHSSVQIEYATVRETGVSLRVLNPYGQTVWQQQENVASQPGLHQESISVRDWPSGIYYVILQSSSDREMRPIVVQH